MKLVTIEDEMPIYNPEVRVIKEFFQLLKRDKGVDDTEGRKKVRATKEFSFIHFYCVYDSRFEAYEGKEKVEVIKRMVDLPEEWKIDNDIRAAIDRYSDLITTPSMGLFKQAQQQLTALSFFLKELDILGENNRTKSGTLVIKPKDVTDMIKSIPDIVRSLIDAENLIEKELDEKQAGKVSDELSMMDKLGTNADLQEGF